MPALSHGGCGFVYLRFGSLQNQSSHTSCACPHVGALPESTLHLGTSTPNLGHKLQFLFSYQGQGNLSPVLRSAFVGGSSPCSTATTIYGPLLSCQKEGSLHIVMVSAAFPHLLPRGCWGKTVIPSAEGQGHSFLLSVPSSSLGDGAPGAAGVAGAWYQQNERVKGDPFGVWCTNQVSFPTKI